MDMAQQRGAKGGGVRRGNEGDVGMVVAKSGKEGGTMGERRGNLFSQDQPLTCTISELLVFVHGKKNFVV